MKRYFSSIKQYSLIVLACVLLATIAGLVLAKSQPTVYQVTATLLVQSGAPGTTYPGGPNTTDSATKALTYSAEIPTRTIMQYIIAFDPQLQQHHFTADDLVLDVVPTASPTSPTISLLATATHQADAVLVANDVARGFADYVRFQSQQHLDDLRKNLQTQIISVQQQKQHWESLISTLPNNTVPQYAIYNNNLIDSTHTLDTLQQQLQQLPVTVKGDVSEIQPAALKDATTTAKGLIIIAVTAGVGLFVGILIMLLVIFLDNRLRSDEQVKEKLGMAYLGSLSNNSDFAATPSRAIGSVADELSDICTNLRLTGVLAGQWQAPQGAVLLVTSPRAAEGKTTLAAAIAAIVASAGCAVVVIDGNLQQPSTHLAFGMSAAGVGLSGLLKGSGNENADEAVVRSTTPGVWLLPAGTRLDGASFLLQQKLPGILKQLRAKTDLVIIDGPALLSGADASQMANMADGVALVVDARHEKLPLLLRAKDLLNSVTHTPAGIIMNRLTDQRRDRYYATAYPGNVAPEKWMSVGAHTSNGNDLSNGQKFEPEIGIPVNRTSSPAPSGMSLMSLPPTPIMPQSPTRPASTPQVVPLTFPNHASMMQQNLSSTPHRPDMAPPPQQ